MNIGIDHPALTVALRPVTAPAPAPHEVPSARNAAHADTVSRAFLFCDIVGSTRLAEELGDRRFAALLRRHNAVVTAAARRSGALHVAFLGDGYLIVFPHTRAALACAAAIQREIAELRQLHGDPLRVRLGVNAGAALREADSYVGRNVILARRLCEHAAADEVLVSARLRDAAGHLAERLGTARPHWLKGLTAPEPACALEWR